MKPNPDYRDELLRKILDPPGPRRVTGLVHPLKFYSSIYSIPLVTIKRIHKRYNPILLDCPVKLLRVLMKQPGPRINLVGIERVIASRFASKLR